MTIDIFGNKLYSGLKQDRKSASLGSSADGTNNGITLIDNYVRCKVYNSSGVEQTEFTSAKLRSDIGTSAFENVTMTGSHTVAQGDRIVMQTDGGDSSNKILFLRNNSNGNDNPSNTSYVRYESGSFSTQSKSMTGSMIFNGSTVNLSSSTDEADSYPTSNEKFGLQIDASASQIGQTLTSVTFKLKRVGNNPAKLGTGCYSFDGSNDTVNLGNDLDTILTGDFSFTTWAYMPNATSSNNKTIICKPATTSWANPYHSFTIQHTGGNIDFQTNNGSTGSNVNIDLACGQGWHHIAVTKSGTTFTLYIDGTTSESQTISGTAWGTQDWIIGNTPYNTRYFDGDVDDMSFWSRALTATEIGKLVNDNDTPWTKTGSSVIIQNGVGGGTSVALNTDDRISNSISALTDTKWVCDFDVKISSIASARGFIPLSINDGTGDLLAGDAIAVEAWDQSGYTKLRIKSIVGSSADQTGGMSTALTDGTQYYCRLVRSTATATELSIYTASTRTGTPHGTSTISNLSSSVGGLDTVGSGSDQFGNSGETASYEIDNIKIYDDKTTPSGTAEFQSDFADGYGGGDAQLVSSLTNRSEGKAYYSMDSTSLDATVTHSNDFSSDNMVDQDSSKIGISNGSLDYTIVLDNSNDASSWDLGATLSDTAWVCRFKMTVSSITQSDGTFVRGAFGLSSLPSSSNSQQSHDFIGLQTRVSNVYEERRYLDADGGAIDGDGEGTIAYGLASSQTTYVEMIRTGATSYTIQLFSDSDYSTQLANKVTGTCASTLTGLRYFGIWNDSSGTSSNQTAGTIDDVKIYNGVTSLDGCKNDFSTTSDLEALTGVRTNSIFQQTDDTPTYWWYNGTSWVLDGTTEVDLTSSSQTYTQVGTTVVKTTDTITATNTSASSAGDGTQRVYTALPSTLSNTEHTTDFDLKITANAGSGVDPDVTPIMYTAGTDPFHTGNTQDGFGCDMYSDNGLGVNYTIRAIEKNGTDNDYSTGIDLTPQTQYYCRLKRNSSTQGTMEVYTNSARTTHASGSPQTLSITGGTGGEDCTHLQSGAWSQSGSTSYIVSNVKLQNGRSTWLD